MHEEVVRKVEALAARLGVVGRAEILAERSHLVLALTPHPIVARVALATSAARVGMAWLAREVAVSHFLGRELATQPSAALPAGPHDLDGLVVSFWERETLAGTLDPAEAGRKLAACHRRLAPYPHAALPWMGAWEEARGVRARARASEHLTHRERDVIDRAFERCERIVESAPRRTASMQAVHGDAHLGNVLTTTRGTLWTDWEDAFVGPIEHDLACLRSRAELFGEDREAIEAALGAYDREHDPSLATDLGVVRNAQVVVWLAVFAERQPELVPRMRARLEKLALTA